MKRIIFGLAAAVVMATAANAADPAKTMDTSLGKIMVDQNGMTLYTFDKDTKGADTSACVGKCIVAWPPLIAAEGAEAEHDWTIVNVTDKDGMATKMWAHDGWPVYLFVKDTKPGDVAGDGVGGVWHVVQAE